MALATLLCLPALSVHAAPKAYCGQIANSIGPFDYRDPANASMLQMVEPYHFTDEVEQGIKGNTGPIGGDIDYTLRAFPNHPRALAAMARIAIRDKVVLVSGAKYPVECYFVRAMEFQPDDGSVRAAYANYLQARGKSDAALAMLRDAAALAPDDATINYNYGLLLYKTGQYEQANLYAQLAYAHGFPLPGLKQLLEHAGKWREATP